MERVKQYRQRAAQLRKIAAGTTDETTRKSLLAIVAEYEQLAKARLALVNTPQHVRFHRGN
jgi:hypothetical protein